MGGQRAGFKRRTVPHHHVSLAESGTKSGTKSVLRSARWIVFDRHCADTSCGESLLTRGYAK